MWFYANKTLTIVQSGRAVPRHVWVLIHKCLITGVMTNRLKREVGGHKETGVLDSRRNCSQQDRIQHDWKLDRGR